MKNKQGFTLVELLVVIAIIGILSTVAVVNLNSARDKAKIAALKGNLTGIIPGIILCHDSNLEINSAAATACDGTAAPSALVPICTGSAINWPTLDTNATYGNCDSTASSGTFSYSATLGATTVTCTDSTGCTTP